MAKARLLHNEISKSLKVDRLPLPARLLFTWMISWADDKGSLKGEPKYIKATVVPLTNWSVSNIKKYILLMKGIGLIHYWQQNNEWFIQLVNWNDYQRIRKDRRTMSNLPSFPGSNGNQMTTNSRPNDNQTTPQANISESNPIEVNKGEYKEKRVADNNSFKKVGDLINPVTYKPDSEIDNAAYETWRKLEIGNPSAFKSTYLAAAKKGLPADLFYQFTSEIRQDPSIKNRGAVFNKKVDDYFNTKT